MAPIQHPKHVARALIEEESVSVRWCKSSRRVRVTSEARARAGTGTRLKISMRARVTIRP